MAGWKTAQHLEDHLYDHRAEFSGATIEDYDASAQSTLDVGTYFEHFHERSGEWRTGCFDRATGRLTILDQDGYIVAHFHCDERYVRNQPDSTYD